MRQILKNSLKDFFTLPILALVWLPLVLNICLFIALIYIYGDRIFSFALSLMPQWFLHITQGDAWWSQILYQLSHMGIYMLLGLCFIICVLICNCCFSLFYTSFIVKYVQKTHFSHIPINPSNSILSDAKHFMKDIAIFALLFVLCVPLYFIPICGTIVLFVLGLCFFKRRTFYDVGSCIIDNPHIRLKNKRFESYLYALVAYIPSLVPLFNGFCMPLQILIITHTFFTYFLQNADTKDSM